MRWYAGGIAEAVTTSKSRNAIFVVYIEGIKWFWISLNTKIAL